MDFIPTVTFSAISGLNYHQIMLYYPATFSDASAMNLKDLQIFHPLCYLNNQRIRKCSINVATNVMTMNFQFGLTANTKYHLKWSIIDPRDSQVNGFMPSTAVSTVVLTYQPYGGSVYYT